MYTNLTYLHETSLMSRFLDMELIYHLVLCRAQTVLQIGENQKSIFSFFPKLWNLKTVKTSNLKAHNSLSQKILFR